MNPYVYLMSHYKKAAKPESGYHICWRSLWYWQHAGIQSDQGVTEECDCSFLYWDIKVHDDTKHTKKKETAKNNGNIKSEYNATSEPSTTPSSFPFSQPTNAGTQNQGMAKWPQCRQKEHTHQNENLLHILSSADQRGSVDPFWEGCLIYRRASCHFNCPAIKI